MSFLVSQTMVVLVDIMLGFTLNHEPDTGEDEGGSDGLHALEYGETHDDTHGNRYQRLHIIIYTHYGRTQRLLTIHHADVAQEGTEEDDVARFPPGAHRNLGERNIRYMSYRERPDEEGCPGKHPLVNREERILLNQWLEERQIESERKLCRDAEQVAPDISHLGIASRSTCQIDFTDVKLL